MYGAILKFLVIEFEVIGSYCSGYTCKVDDPIKITSIKRLPIFYALLLNIVNHFDYKHNDPKMHKNSPPIPHVYS